MTDDANQFGIREIPNDALRLSDIPSRGAEFWNLIDGFALTFDGYEHRGGDCGKFANAVAALYWQTGALPRSLSDLRTCLFFEQRRWHHWGQHPEPESHEYVYALVDAIRDMVEASEDNDEARGVSMPLEDNSIQLVPAQGEAKGFDKKYQEKWLIYCPAIANDALLYMITALDSYSIRSYGGHLGVNTTGRHAEGIQTTGEFMEKLHPEKLYEMSGLGLAVDKADKWADFIEGKWKIYREKHGLG